MIFANSASDVFALLMLLVIFLSLGVVGILLFLMRRKASRRDAMVDDLLEEVSSPSPSEPPGKTPRTPLAPWEKQADWWKKPS